MNKSEIKIILIKNNNACFFDWSVLENESKIVLELGMNCLHCDAKCFLVCYIFELRVIDRFRRSALVWSSQSSPVPPAHL